MDDFEKSNVNDFF